MSDRRSFLQAMIAAPEDDTPRLVYADWLEEHGQGEADRDRAEFIRAQCELARLRYDSPESASRYQALQRREVELRVRHEKAWAAELNLPPNRSTRCWFHRGMVARAWCTVRYFVEHADALLAAAPVEVVCFRRGTARNITELPRCPGFSRLRGVEFLMDETPAAVVGRFFEAVPVGHLRTVDLNTVVVNRLSPTWEDRNVALTVTLARCPGLAGLKRLRLRHAGVGDEGGMALARTPHLAGLELLGLEDNAFSPAVEAELRERFGRRLCLGRPDYPNFTLGELGWA
jgi:uncharacterized protein (TIGR02996 family)